MGIENSPELRAMVREVLREALAARAGQSPTAKAAPEHAQPAPAQPSPAQTESVRITCDGDLQALIGRLTAPGVADAVRAGRLRFALAGVATAPAPATDRTASPPFDGVISERKLKGLPPGATVRLTRSAVLTPLAKDLGRRLGLNFERIG